MTDLNKLAEQIEPRRVQLRRTKGWRMPVNTVSVARPGKFGNPFTPLGCAEAGYKGTARELAERCVGAFRAWIDTPHWQESWDGEASERRRSDALAGLPELRGKNLACWCAHDMPCHADVLIELANREPAALRAHAAKGGR